MAFLFQPLFYTLLGDIGKLYLVWIDSASPSVAGLLSFAQLAFFSLSFFISPYWRPKSGMTAAVANDGRPSRFPRRKKKKEAKEPREMLGGMLVVTKNK